MKKKRTDASRESWLSKPDECFLKTNKATQVGTRCKRADKGDFIARLDSASTFFCVVDPEKPKKKRVTTELPPSLLGVLSATANVTVVPGILPVARYRS